MQLELNSVTCSHVEARCPPLQVEPQVQLNTRTRCKAVTLLPSPGGTGGSTWRAVHSCAVQRLLHPSQGSDRDRAHESQIVAQTLNLQIFCAILTETWVRDAIAYLPLAPVALSRASCTHVVASEV